MVWVAAAGPAMNIALATLAGFAFHLVDFLPVRADQWVAQNLENAIVINVVLAVFNMIPLPRSMAGGSPSACCRRAGLSAGPARALRHAHLIGLLIVLPMIGQQMGMDLNIVARLISVPPGPSSISSSS